MLPGGPPALRTPGYMDGVPHLKPCQQQKVDDSRKIHERGRALFRSVVLSGGVAILEQPPSALSWLEPDNHHMIQEYQGHIACIDACTHGFQYAKSWAFYPNECLCPWRQTCASLSSTKTPQEPF